MAETLICESLSDKGSVSVPIERYNELVRNETLLNVIRNMHISGVAAYNYVDYLDVVLGTVSIKAGAEDE